MSKHKTKLKHKLEKLKPVQLAVIAVVMVVAVFGLVYYSSQVPVVVEDSQTGPLDAVIIKDPVVEPPVDVVVESNADVNKISDIYAALYSAGIEDAIIDITSAGVVIVDFEIPAGQTKEAVQGFIIGVVFELVPESSSISIQALQEGVLVEEINVAISDVNAIVNKEITAEEFELRIQRN